MTVFLRRTYVAALALAVLCSCASVGIEPAPDAFVAQRFAPPSKQALILHLHVPASEAAYNNGDPAAVRLVQDLLKAQGYRVGVVAHDDYRVALDAELRQLVKAAPAPTRLQIAEAEARALAVVARVACETTGSPLLLRTRLTTRPAKVWQSFAFWDGQKRQIKFLGTDAVKANVEGAAPGISLEAVAVNGAGSLVIKNYGGVSLSFIVGTAPLKQHERDDLFRDETELSEGVALALNALRK